MILYKYVCKSYEVNTDSYSARLALSDCRLTLSKIESRYFDVVNAKVLSAKLAAGEIVLRNRRSRDLSYSEAFYV